MANIFFTRFEYKDGLKVEIILLNDYLVKCYNCMDNETECVEVELHVIVSIN